MELEFHKNRFEGIQLLRGIAALLVVAEHIKILSCGAFGVDIFFVISGFVMMLSTAEKKDHFLLKRIIRIMPFYWIMTGITFLATLLVPNMFEMTRTNGVQLLKSLCLIPFEITEGVYQPILRVGWTVYYEVFFYLLFFIALKISHKYRGLIASGLCIIITLLGKLVEVESIFLRFYTDPILLEFVFGMALYYVAKVWYEKCQKTNKTIVQVQAVACSMISVVLFLGLLASKSTIDISGIRRPLLWGIPALILVFSFLIIGLAWKVQGALVTIGNMSFSIYLVHYYPAVFLDRMIFQIEELNAVSLMEIGVIYLVVIVLAFIAYELVEKRLTKALLTRFKV